MSREVFRSQPLPTAINNSITESGSKSATFEYRQRISDIPADERPRERFEQAGAAGVSHRELLAIILCNGPRGVGALALADRVLQQFGGLSGLARAQLEDLQQVHGLGKVKAVEIKAALELGKRMVLATPEQKPQIKTAADAAQILMLEMGLSEQEELRTMLLDTRNRVLATPLIYRGSLNSASMRIGEVFKEAIRANCASMIVAHCHPSGDPTPSAEDIAVTKELAQAGKLLNVELLDHIIVAQNRYVSFKERGLVFE